MFNTPYETSLGSQFRNIPPIVYALNQADIEGTLYSLKGFSFIKAVVKGDLHLEGIPPFNHPIVINESKVKRPGAVTTIAVDLRPFSNRILVDRENMTFEVMDEGPAQILIKQAMLQIIWLQNPRRVADELTDLPMITFTRWVSETLARKFNLQPAIQQDVAILAAWWYYCQAATPDQSTNIQDLLHSIAPRIVRCVKFTTMNRVQEVLGNVGTLTNISSFIEELKRLGHLRLNEMSIHTFYTAITGSWFGGPNVREVIQIATEYPPYFTALVHAAVKEKMYNKTPLAVIVLAQKKELINSFDLAMKLVLQTIEV
jgi:hypothetical protein